MKFTHDGKEDRGECVAKLYEFDGGSELCLAMKAQDGQTVWLYETTISIQIPCGLDSNPIRRFYPGDKITIEF